MLNYIVISGSHRAKSQSSKIAHAIQFLLKGLPDTGETEFIDLKQNPLPLWDESVWDKDPAANNKWDKLWKPFSEKLKRADGVVVISPEWNGTVPAGLKNFFHFCKNEDLGHKPGLIVTVSSSMGGAYPIAELRMSSYKNNRLCYIPDHVIVRNAEKVFNNIEKPESPDDERIITRMKYSLGVLREYSLALRQVRQSPTINFKDFANGM
ncbi:MAG: NADPH-dependent FMN reductase [Bdellovibrionales bacterium]